MSTFLFICLCGVTIAIFVWLSHLMRLDDKSQTQMKDDWFACRLMVGFMGYLIVKQIPMDEVSGILEAVDIKSIRTKDIGTDNTSQVITIYDDSYAMCEFDDKTYFFSIKEKSEYSEYDVKPDFVREAGSR